MPHIVCKFGGFHRSDAKYSFIDGQTVSNGTISNEYVTVQNWPFGDTYCNITANKSFTAIKDNAVGSGFLNYDKGDVISTGPIASAGGVTWYIFEN